MTHPSAIVAIAVLLGVAAGSLAPVAGLAAAPFVLVAWAGVAFGVRQRSARATTAAIAVGFCAFGLWSGARDDRRATQSPLTAFFERRAELGRGAEPVIVEGVLRRDAATTSYGASLSVLVERAIVEGRPYELSGGARMTVGGTLTPGSVHRWRAGRRVRMPVTFRRVERYLNPGVADQERRFARLGSALRGSVKSAILVDVVDRGSTLAETAASVRAWVRRTVSRHVGRLSPRLWRHRDGHPDW